jgi:hypothetical protein
VTHMKTTVEIAGDLLIQAKRVAVTDGVTLRELIESGLRRELAGRMRDTYRMPDASFSGEGVQSGVAEGDWSLIREMIYEGRGG